MESFINSVDSQMRQRQEQQKLAAISARVESYEAVEGASEEVEKVRTLRIINNLASKIKKDKSFQCDILDFIEMHCFVVILCFWKFGLSRL